MIIDFHTHCFPDALAPKALPTLSRCSGNAKPVFDGTAKGLAEKIKKDGAEKAVVLNIATNPHQQKKVNDFAISLLDSETLIPFGSVHPDSPDALNELQRLHDAGIKGVKLHPNYQEFFVDDERLFPIYEKIGELGMITVFHAGVDIGIPDPVYCPPKRLKAALSHFGDTPVVAAHMGGFLLWREVIEVLADTNIYVDTSFSCGALPPPWAKEIIDTFGAQRVLFGSDMPWSSTENEKDYIKSLGLDEENEALVLGGNAKKLLGI